MSATDFSPLLSFLLLHCPHSQSLNGGAQWLEHLIPSSSHPDFQQLGETMIGSTWLM